MRSILVPAVYWALAVAVADLGVYPFVVRPAEPGCEFPAPPPAYSADHWVRVLAIFFIFLAAGTVVFAVTRIFRRVWVPATLMCAGVIAISALSFDHDFPNCNSFTPEQSLLLAVGIYGVPTLLLWIGWRSRRWGESDVK